MSFQIFSKVTVKENEPLRNHSSFHIGGNARLFASPYNEDELRGLLDFANKENIPYFVIGKGSNIIFSDAGFSGLIISMSHFCENKMSIRENFLLCSGGALLQTVLEYAKEHSCGGLEFLTYIPGTIGGAIMRNASFKTEGKLTSMSEVVKSVSVIDIKDNGLRHIQRQDLSFGYRTCNLIGIIIEAELSVYPRERKEIENDINNNYNYRKKYHDMSFPSGGCIFKNPSQCEYTAGRLIDLCGLKGFSVGGAKISDKHANFIVNYNKASSSDVMKLIDIVRLAVRKKFSIDLELEIEYVE